MKRLRHMSTLWALCLSLALLPAGVVAAETKSADEVAKELANPAGSLASLIHDQPVSGQQIIVRVQSGVLVSVTQPASPGLSKGQKVYIEGNGEGAHVRPQ